MSDRTPTLSWRFAAPIVVWLALLLIPHPTGLSRIPWRYLGLFADVIVALVLKPLPPAAVDLIGVSLARVQGDIAPFNRVHPLRRPGGQTTEARRSDQVSGSFYAKSTEDLSSRSRSPPIAQLGNRAGRCRQLATVSSIEQ